MPKPLPRKPPLTPLAKALRAERVKVHENLFFGQVVQRLKVARWMGPLPERQFRFRPDRLYRADFAFVFPQRTAAFGRGLLVEVDGEGHREKGTGTWVPGGHHRTKGREADLERDALAQLAGWRVLRVTPGQVKRGLAVEWAGRLIGAIE